jgi:F-type H+-transporting ATPase subunit a
MDIHISLAAEELFKVGPIPVTNSMMTMFLVMALVLTAGILIARKAQNIPTGRSQGIAEMIVGFLVDLVEGTGGKTIGRRILPLISGIFIFILFANFSGLIPGVGTVGKYEEHAVEDDHAAEEEHAVEGETATAEEESATEAIHEEEEEHEKTLVPFFRAPTADLNMTLALSIIAFVSIQIAGISAHGVVGRIKHMADPPFLFPIELISELSRILSLAARLFGNVFAGEVLLGVMFAMGAAIKIAIVPFLFPVVFLGLEVLFGTIQALVFALLTLIYIMLAAAHSNHHDEASHEHATDDAHGSVPAAQPSGD